jgi:hypothetical protein
MFNEQSENTTIIDASDAPNGNRLDNSERLREHYRRLSAANTLKWNGKWKDKQRETKENAAALLGAVACQLELTDYQKQRAHQHLNTIGSDYSDGYGLSTVAATLCGIVGWQDDRSYHPNSLRNDWRGENDMANFLRSEDIRFSTYARCWGAIENELGVEK